MAAKTRARIVRAQERASRAIQMRAQGATYARIAQALGFANKGAAYKAVTRELRRNSAESVDELRKLQAEALDELQREVWRYKDEHEKLTLFAIDRLLRIHDLRCKLFGLYPKSDVAVSTQVIIREAPPGYLEERQEQTNGE